ncbi:MAG: hypothetical protein F6J86_11890 [Symploca sp. SIO1B1]|nr:hypothetical protein [Symploca sp. SIO1B1]
MVIFKDELVADEDTLLISEENFDILSNELSSPVLISGAAKNDSSLSFDVADQLLSSAEIKDLKQSNIENAEKSFRQFFKEIDIADTRIGENQARIEEIRKVNKQSFSELESLVEEL